MSFTKAVSEYKSDAGAILQRSFISMVRPSVHTNLKTKLFENAFQTGGICWKTPALRFRVK